MESCCRPGEWRKNYITIVIILFLCCFVWLLPDRIFAEESDWVRRYKCLSVAGDIVIDGVGSEIAWQLAPEVGEFTRFTARGEDPGTKVTYRTTVKMLWDEKNLYFLVTAEDRDIYSTMLEGDVECLCREETIEFFIDPDGDGNDYAEIHINCLGTMNDICIPFKPGTHGEGFTDTNGNPVNWDDLYAWTLDGMKYVVVNHGSVNKANDRDIGTVIEVAMPWSGFGKVAGSTNIPPRSGDIWRINVNRYERPTREREHLSGWAPLERRSYHVPERFGYVTFIGE